MSVNDVVIIGAGPAGLATAIQLKRYKIEPVLLEKAAVGGLLKNANLVENYPGFPYGISGRDLVGLFKEQLEKSRVNLYFEEVLKLDYQNDLFIIKTTQRKLSSRIVVVASGTKPKRFPIAVPKEAEKRLFYEVHRLAHLLNEKIVIIGSGDAAFDYALNLSKRNEVIILNRSKKVKCLPLIFERALKNSRIFYMENVEVKEIKYHDSGLILTCHSTTGEQEFYTSYLVIAIGREPFLDFLSDELKRGLKTLQKAKKLYMVGDVQNGIYRQTAIAVGNGIKTAMEIYRELRGL